MTLNVQAYFLGILFDFESLDMFYHKHFGCHSTFDFPV